MQRIEGLEPVARATTASIIADRIRDGIMDGRFAPGSQLGEVQLAAQLEVSRGPVREALQRLIQEGLVHSEPHRGVFVAQLDTDDVRDVYFMRGALERAAVRALVSSGPSSGLDGLTELLENMDAAAQADRWAEVAALDLAFHEQLVATSGSPRLLRMFTTVVAEMRMCLSALYPSYPERGGIVTEHRKLLAAIIGGNEQEALAMVEVHLDDAVGRLVAD